MFTNHIFNHQTQNILPISFRLSNKSSLCNKNIGCHNSTLQLRFFGIALTLIKKPLASAVSQANFQHDCRELTDIVGFHYNYIKFAGNKEHAPSVPEFIEPPMMSSYNENLYYERLDYLAAAQAELQNAIVSGHWRMNKAEDIYNNLSSTEYEVMCVPHNFKRASESFLAPDGRIYQMKQQLAIDLKYHAQVTAIDEYSVFYKGFWGMVEYFFPPKPNNVLPISSTSENTGVVDIWLNSVWEPFHNLSFPGALELSNFLEGAFTIYLGLTLLFLMLWYIKLIFNVFSNLFKRF